MSVGYAALFVGGCVDARGQFDEFGTRVVDAAPQIDAPPISQLPDATGQYLMGLLSLGQTTRFIADVELDRDHPAGTGSISVTLRSVVIETGQLTDTPAVTATDDTVTEQGAWDAHYELVLPAEANPITHSTINLVADQHGQLRTRDFFCGTVTGHVVETQTPLDGTTFAAIRIPEGTLGDALPPVLNSCDDEPTAVDAGVTD